MPKSPKVMLVQPPSNIMANRKEGKPALQPLGLGYIAATLFNSGHEDVTIFDALAEGYYNETPFKGDFIRYGSSPEDIEERIRSEAPDIVGVSCMMNLREHQAQEVVDIAKGVSPEILTVMGGNPVTVDPSRYLQNPNLDIAVMGEGERPFLDIVNQVQSHGRVNLDSMVEGVAYRTSSGQVVQKPQKTWEKDLDRIPHPAHQLFDLDLHAKIWEQEGYHYYPGRKFTSGVMARGCPNLCEHCPHDVLFPGYRKRSAEDVFNEVQDAYENHGVRDFQFHEYNGLVHWPTVRDFSNKMIQSGLNQEVMWGWPIGIWLKMLNRDRLDLMSRAGMAYVDLAIESDNQQTLSSLMRGKDVDTNHALDVINWSNDLGLYSNAFFMLGLDGQSKSDIERTIDWSKSLDVNTIAYFIAQPIPGTPFWDNCVRDQRFIEGFEPFHLRYGKANIHVPGVTPQELEGYRHQAREDFVNYWSANGRERYSGPRGQNFLKQKAK